MVPLEDSEYVQMEAIEKIVPDTTTPAEKGEDTVMESSLLMILTCHRRESTVLNLQLSFSDSGWITLDGMILMTLKDLSES